MDRPVTSARSAPLLPHGRWRGFAWSTAACLGTTLLASPLPGDTLVVCAAWAVAAAAAALVFALRTRDAPAEVHA